MPISIDRDRIESIAAKCSTSSQNMQAEAETMQQQMAELREALAGIPNLALADRFGEWQQLFSKMNTSLEQSNAYLQGVIRTVDEFIASLGRM